MTFCSLQTPFAKAHCDKTNGHSRWHTAELPKQNAKPQLRKGLESRKSSCYFLS